MKKIFLLIEIVFIMVILLSDCVGKGQEDRKGEDSIWYADSITALEAVLEQARIDSIFQDSTLNKIAEDLYEKAVEIEVINKSREPVPETSFYKVEWKCNVKNNTNLRFGPSDYQITFDETFEDGNADGLFEVTHSRYLRGVDLPGDSIAEVLLTGRANTQDLSNPAIKMLITEEEFIMRFKNANRK